MIKKRSSMSSTRKKENNMIFFKWLWWKLTGSKILLYNGYHCGCCGKWVTNVFKIPKYLSQGDYWDTWGLCPDCKKEGKEIGTKKPI